MRVPRISLGKLFNVLQSPIGRMASWPMRNIKTFPSKQMYLYLSLVERKEAEFYHNIDRRRYLVWFKWLIFIAFPGQLMVSLPIKLVPRLGIPAICSVSQPPDHFKSTPFLNLSSPKCPTLAPRLFDQSTPFSLVRVLSIVTGWWKNLLQVQLLSDTSRNEWVIEDLMAMCISR